MAPEKVAVIFVPGIFASHLVDPMGMWPAWPINNLFGEPNLERPESNFEKESNMWQHIKNYSPIKKSKMMKIASRFKPGGFPPFSPEDSWNGLYKKIYRPFLEDCHGNTKDLPFEPVVWGAGYNFTGSNAASSAHIWKVIQMALDVLPHPNKGNFLIVTHSMGALPTRYLLKFNNNARKKCLGVIHVVAPNGGSPEFIMRYFRGIPKANEAGGSSPPTRIILGKKGWRTTTAASAIQGAYELFPFAKPGVVKIPQSAPEYPARDRDPFFLQHIVDYVFSDRNPEMTEIDFRGHRSNAKKEMKDSSDKIFKFTSSALSFHNELGDYVFHGPDGNRTAAICLTGKQTVQEVEYEFNGDGNLVKIKPFITDDGDGTVPYWSQRMFLQSKKIKFRNSRGVIDSMDSFAEIKGGLDHSEPFTTEGHKKGVYEEIYTYMRYFYGLE